MSSLDGALDSLTVIEVAEMIKNQDQLVNQGINRKGRERDTLLRLEDKFRKYVQEGEFEVLYGYVWKRSFLSYKKRMLILTSSARLLYLRQDGVYKGTIPWALTKPLSIRKVDATHFDIEVFDKSRVFHLSDSVGGADKWVNGIQQLMKAQKAYVLRSLNSHVPVPVPTFDSPF